MSVDKAGIDLDSRPQSYFWPIGPDTQVSAAIKGERRRRAIRAASETDRVTPLDALYATHALSEADRRALGRLHPSLMGGEYLPDRRETEAEVARININSITSDVTSDYAEARKERILYRVVDEYGGDTLTHTRTRSARRPLSLGELIQFLLAAWPLQEVIGGNGLDWYGAQCFTRPLSEFCPPCAAGIRARIDGWYRGGVWSGTSDYDGPKSRGAHPPPELGLHIGCRRPPMKRCLILLTVNPVIAVPKDGNKRMVRAQDDR